MNKDKPRVRLNWSPLISPRMGDIGIERRGSSRKNGPRRVLAEVNKLTPSADAGMDAIVRALANGQVTAVDLGCENEVLESALEWLASMRVMQ